MCVLLLWGSKARAGAPEAVMWRGAPLFHDEYAWMARQGAADPEVLAHLSAENKYASAVLDHTKPLRRRLQTLLEEWRLPAVLAEAAADAAFEGDGGGDDDSSGGTAGDADAAAAAAAGEAGGGGSAAVQPPPPSPPDLLSSCGRASRRTSAMAWRPAPGFGARGRGAGGHHYWTERPQGSALRVHYRRPLGAAGGAAAGAEPEVVLDERRAAAEAGGGGGGAAAYELCSLEVSPWGRYAAVVERRAPGGAAALRVLRLGGAGGARVCAEVCPVAGPVVWACPAALVNAGGGSSSSSKAPLAPPSVAPGGQEAGGGRRRAEGPAAESLLFLSSDEHEVRALAFGSGDGGGVVVGGDGGSGSSSDCGLSSADAGLWQGPGPPGGAVVYRDPFGVRAHLWRSDHLAAASGGGAAWAVFVAGLAPDGAPLEVRCLPPGADPLGGLGAGGGGGGGAGGWVRLAAVDLTARLAVSAWGGWLFARTWSASNPGGALLAAPTPAASSRGGDDESGVPWQTLLQAEPGCRMEAFFLPPPPLQPQSQPPPPGPGLPAAAGRGGAPGEALLLCWLREGGPGGGAERLVARSLRIRPTAGVASAPPSGGALVAEVVAEADVPLPDAAFLLNGAAWRRAAPPPAPRAETQAAAGAAPGGAGAAPRAGQLLVGFSSLVTPPSQLLLDLAARGAVARVLGGAAPPGFSRAGLRLAAASAAAPDGARVPVTLAWHEGRRAALSAAAGGEGAAVLHAYGSFGLAEAEAGFDESRLLLMALGFTVAVAHVRGGGWRGRAWAEAGRGAAAKAEVSAADLAAAADDLVARGACGRRRLALAGSSAGGWLAAAALAARPGLAAAAALTVPCLDPLGALVEHGQGGLEWGCARPVDEDDGGGGGGGGGGGDPEAAAVRALARWSPYQNLERLSARAHGPAGGGGGGGGDLPGGPHLLLRCALHDRAVGFWDVAKCAARLRRLRAAAGGGSHNDGGGGGGAAGGGGGAPMLLLRAVPGGHGAFEGDCREAALAAAFLVVALVGQEALAASLAAEAGAGAGDGGDSAWDLLGWG
ncbi:MAG: hypothetical protein J3K34DRAFT_516688 [Monoraphidium minutum]|nr:MAG: hypothetical protein J3K34DRAFT_516688 [Monoraphidium minutum]